MSESELTGLIFELYRDMDSMIEFWISATFAVVAAVFIAGDRLASGMRRVVTGLYLIASLLAGLRWVMYLRRNLFYRARLVAEGYPDIPVDIGLLVPVVVLISVMFMAGVVGTVYFLRKPSSGHAVVGAG